MDVKRFLKKASMAYGVSGFEFSNIADLVKDAMSELVNEIRVDALGDVIGVRYGEGPEPRPRIMLAGHMDEIGLMITKIEEGGFLRFAQVGGVDPRILPGHEVIVYGRKPLTGVIGVKPPHMTSREEAGKAHKMEDLFIDIGIPEEEVRQLVNVGDVVTFKREVTELTQDAMSGKSFDDRAGVAVILVCLEELRRYKVNADVYAVATTQEEVGLRGALVSTYGIVPDIGIAIDVCHAETPGVPDWKTFSMGKGPSITQGANIHPAVYAGLDKAAKELGISVQPDVTPAATGTDAWAIQVARSGVATGLVSIPERYMHTSVETFSVQDVDKAGRLIARFISSVDAAFVKELKTWT
ncbi:MAG: M42 family metallopeptidase [Firmicutes bacterium]|nr:M42 family metallopeptidase [Candidatus Fermentithermobacillaceae bacterium]